MTISCFSMFSSVDLHLAPPRALLPPRQCLKCYTFLDPTFPLSFCHISCVFLSRPTKYENRHVTVLVVSSEFMLLLEDALLFPILQPTPVFHPLLCENCCGSPHLRWSIVFSPTGVGMGHMIFFGQ